MRGSIIVGEKPRQIKVIAEDSVRDICVTVNGFCNHANTEWEDLEFAATSFWEDAGVSVMDDSETINVEVCQRCGAYKDEDGAWNEN